MKITYAQIKRRAEDREEWRRDIMRAAVRQITLMVIVNFE